MRLSFLAPTAAVLTLLAAGWGGQATPAPSPFGAMAAASTPAACAHGPGTCALIDANERMHRDMAVAWTGDADADFLRTMVPHHQGAVDMARAALAHGKDPEVRALAQAILEAQEREIALMERLLDRLDAPAPKTAGHLHH